MAKIQLSLAETTTAGHGSRERIVRASAEDSRDWMANAPVSAALARRGILHAGVADALHPYRVVRERLSGTFFMACFAGQGRIWLEGRWQTCRAGSACLAPPEVAHAYRAMPRHRWGFVWVRYAHPPMPQPVVTAHSPLLARFDAQPLRAAVEGLFHEARAGGALSLQDAWADLIDRYARQFAQPWRGDDRLHRLWEIVTADLAADWPLPRLARGANMTDEWLRRLCRETLGRTPKQHLTWLRMERAAALLHETSDKLEVIAKAVGYEDAFSFSDAFQRWFGCRPSDYRATSNAKSRRNGPT